MLREMVRFESEFSEDVVESITLVCTSHNEGGACTEEALLSILRRLEPDVVFLEMRASDLSVFAMQRLEVRPDCRYAKPGRFSGS